MSVSKRFSALVLGLILGSFLATSASAKDFHTVKLNNGTTFETLRQPVVADWDPEMVMIITDSGNWVGFPKADISSITASIETSGLGTIIDEHTILVGILNDFDEDDEEDEDGLDEETRLRRQLVQAVEGLSSGEGSGAGGSRETPDYTTEQFVNPEDAHLSGGIPLSYVNEN